MSRLPLCSFSVALALIVSLGSVPADEPAAPAATLERSSATMIGPAEALAHVGEKATVEFVVEGARKLDDKGVCFLNSLDDHRKEGNFTVVIFRDTLARFAADGVANPAATFLGKTIRVSGVVSERSGQAQIVVETPTQIEVVEVAEPVSPEAPSR